VVKRFGSVEKMCLAEERDWVEVEGIGKVTAKLCVQALHGKDK
jgi:DNA integrity scanning protein DisA with diadenylate cyclase activity